VLSSIALRLLTFWGAAAVAMVALWAYARHVRNYAWVDAGWSLSFTVAVVLWVTLFDVPAAAWPLAAMIAAWSLRLGVHLLRDRIVGHPEEGRYVELRKRWGDGAFFVFYQAQALLAAVLAIAMVVPFAGAPAGGGPDVLRFLAIGLFGFALGFEAIADAQLARWKADPAHRGQVCDVGLWRWSRHPNYFGEWLVWVSYLLYALAWPLGWLAALGPALMFASIWKVTGIPATEAQALRSRGDAYRRYQARTSAFVPWPPRRAPGDAA
jgi:steroid 5-alpha reductase family enzyme